MTRLRKIMLEELQRRNFAKSTIQYYLQAMEDFATYFHKPPDQLTPDHLRQYQAYLLTERKLQPRTARLHVCALRFFFRKTLKRPLPPDDIPYPRVPRRLPTILTVEEVARLIDSARNLFERTMLMVLYSTGMRNAEMRYLLHVLPKGFVRIRFFGFLANRRRATLLPLCRQLLPASPAPSSPCPASPQPPSSWSCPVCGGPMIIIERLTAEQLLLRAVDLRSFVDTS